MSYSQELSSVKRMPRYYGDTSTVSGLCDEVARARADGKLDISAFQTYSSNAITEINGIYPVVCTDNYDTTYDISMDTIPLFPGSGINFVEQKNSLGYTSSVAINVTAAGNTFPITGTNETTSYTHGADCSSFYLSNTVGRAGSVVTFFNDALNFAAYPSTDVSATWYNIINGANNRSNCYCIRFTNDLTSVSLENYSAYDKVTVVHSNQYTPNCELHWNGYTKVFPSGLYCEMVKGTNDQNQTDWFFTNSGMINNLEWN